MDIIDHLQNLLGMLPGPLQPLVSALAGMIPFVEGEGGAAIGIVGGVHPVAAALAAMAGNFLIVAGLVIASSGAREAVATRRGARTPVAVGAGGAGSGAGAADASAQAEFLPAPVPENPRKAARREKFQRAYERFGVPGVSLLGPLLLPTHFTATMLAATGVRKGWILLWQGIAIVGWTTLTALIITGVISVVQ